MWDLLEDFGITGLLSAIASLAFFIWVFFAMVIQSSTERRCLGAGYPESHVTWNFISYCEVRVEQTDHVVPLAIAERNPRQ